MKNSVTFLLSIFLVSFSIASAQQDSLAITSENASKKELKEKDYEPYNALAPAKAAFYSAILPGLGQAYNGSYWKIPIAYGGLGTGVYFYLKNDKDYDRYRDAYKNRLAGRPDEFTVDGKQRITTDGLIRAQELFQKNKEISILVTVGVYILNIIDANVEAHLRQFNVDEDLSVKPGLDYDAFSGKTNYGLTLNYRF
ncbi:DUF5683 domain-containing protein [Christiangramia forsetii]|uniref:DUF5683 domain-containing protein n=1 Tax=Christiangramia forsetii (strain DSM 17595 / CGMCC 1.15422 / KT0803) TaxID=411154 RepID=A0LZI5_CHRFK|nr:DUF5683 domain-containing protein [Christiangramia forsetii]CAL65780.1 conserved hypothetical protein, secreted [Christiangramia forsetii KT0803]